MQNNFIQESDFSEIEQDQDDQDSEEEDDLGLPSQSAADEEEF